jgi:hypothetical protein
MLFLSKREKSWKRVRRGVNSRDFFLSHVSSIQVTSAEVNFAFSVDTGLMIYQ